MISLWLAERTEIGKIWRFSKFKRDLILLRMLKLVYQRDQSIQMLQLLRFLILYLSNNKWQTNYHSLYVMILWVMKSIKKKRTMISWWDISLIKKMNKSRNILFSNSMIANPCLMKLKVQFWGRNTKPLHSMSWSRQFSMNNWETMLIPFKAPNKWMISWFYWTYNQIFTKLSTFQSVLK